MKDGDIVFCTPEREFLRYTGDGRVLVEGVEVTGPRATAIMETLRRWLGIANVQLPAPGGGTVLNGVVLNTEAQGDTTFQSGKGAPGGAGGDVIFTKPEPCVIAQLADLAEPSSAPSARAILVA